ncbi:MAG: hypothetical protein A2W19_05905 [Spirochaetes bacterium RBG_16_49_21]|nr:MAG: hypothetical protein A2W19_05905 [Spirochaetes bacterium RBG_16_49_21]
MPIRGFDEIDLDSHSVIEASAGSGKTHTIQDLVVELLRRGKVQSLDEILAVTFTEKAAGELKDRIRNNIKEALTKERSEILKISLDNFDSASIHTIHGFCNKVLQEYAFENREKFQNELVDDRLVYRKILRKILREQWPRQYGGFLQRILKLSNFPDITADGRSRWEARVIEIALRYEPAAGDALVPLPDQDIVRKISGMEDACTGCLEALASLAGAIDEQDIGRSALCRQYTNLNIRKNSIPKRVRILCSLLELVAAHKNGRISLAEVADFLAGPDIPDGGFHELNTGWLKGVSDYDEKFPRLLDIIEVLEKLRSLDFAGLRNLLAAATVRQIKTESAEYKKIRGLISYDDMVNHVYAALTDGSGGLKRLLQKRYRYALVDEFQDTDMQQWRIFKAVFLETEQNRLFVIGDPKQAIYGFRGADINAYYLARDEMLRSHAARYYCLIENWRSSPGLIGVFNALFGSGWFFASGIDYIPSRYPSKEDPPDHPDTSPLCVIDCGRGTGTEAKFRAAGYIAGEINGLIHGGAGVAPKDIAVLVKKWAEAEAVEKALNRAGIRYSYYKKEGLYQSREALELFYLLSCLAKPGDTAGRNKALVTRFFNVPLRLLPQYDDLPADHPASVLFDRWRAFSDRKNWPHLFQSIMEDSGILFRSEIDDYDRTMINYRTIMQNLLVEAAKGNYGIHDIVDYLSRLRNQDASLPESHNLQRIDLEEPGVQIMTIHASKGLQFRVVFIAGGFTQRDTAEFWTYHRPARTFDLLRDEGSKGLYDREMNGEEERLFYVALTRAKERLYVPVFQPTATSKGSCGMLGEKMPVALETVRHEQGVRWVDFDSDKFEKSPSPIGSPMKKGSIMMPDPLFPDPHLGFLDRRISVDSFSGLRLQLDRQKIPEEIFAEFGDAGLQSGEDDIPFAPVPEHEPGTPQSIPELPPSRETGLMLHEILERIDFGHVRSAKSPGKLLAPDAEAGRIIRAAVQKHAGLLQQEDSDLIKNETAKIVWNALHAPLNGSDLVLCAMDEKIHEVEFYYPCSAGEFSPAPGIAHGCGFMHGFIDVIFLFNNRYYIVDWKSNYLEEGYAADELEKNIRDMHYDLQISIYASATIRWLKRVVADYSYEALFGGVYYLYLRGMDVSNPGSGVYFWRPREESGIY